MPPQLPALLPAPVLREALLREALLRDALLREALLREAAYRAASPPEAGPRGVVLPEVPPQAAPQKPLPRRRPEGSVTSPSREDPGLSGEADYSPPPPEVLTRVLDALRKL